MPGGISQPNIYLTFPGQAALLMPNDMVTITMERIASVIPLPGSTGDGAPRLFWIDLGLANYSVIMQGTLRDFSSINSFQIAEKFMRSWKNDMINISTNTDVGDLTQVQIDDATWGRMNYYCVNSKFDLIRSGGQIKWDYYLRFGVVIPPSIGHYGSFVGTIDPIVGQGAAVHVGFPVADNETTIQTDKVEINYDRMATTIPLPGNKNENTPRFAYTDLGLSQPIMTIEGKFPDVMRPSPFEVMEAFYRNWSGRITGDSRQDSQVEGLVGMCLDDPGGTRAFFGVPQMMTLTRFGGKAHWQHKMSMWIVRADESGV